MSGDVARWFDDVPEQLAERGEAAWQGIAEWADQEARGQAFADAMQQAMDNSGRRNPVAAELTRLFTTEPEGGTEG